MKSEEKTIELLEEINGKLDKLIGLLGIQGRDEIQQIKILTSFGFNSKEVGTLLGIPDGTVRRKNLELRKTGG